MSSEKTIGRQETLKVRDSGISFIPFPSMLGYVSRNWLVEAMNGLSSEGTAR